MSRQLLTSGSVSIVTNIFPITFTERGLAIEVTTTRLRSSLPIAGSIQIYLSWDDVWIPVGEPKLIGFKQIIDVPYSAYRVSFTPARGLTEGMINIYQYTLQLAMSIGFPPASIPVTNNTRTKTVATSTVDVSLLAAVADRFGGGLIVNNSTQVLWINTTGSAAAPSFPSVRIPANGGTYDIAEGYMGVVRGIWTGADPNGKAEIQEYVT